MVTKGFITVATGKWYCYLAQNLVMSYRLFANCDLPFYVITDKKGEKKLKKYFDGVIVVDNPHYNFLDKIDVYKNTPFDETIFLDADMNIIKDISFIFDEFEKNGSEVSCYGYYEQIREGMKPNHFGNAAVKYFSLVKFIAFGGGMYYYKKSLAADKFIDFIYNDLIPNYDKYELLHIGAYYGNDISCMADEPLMELAMLVKNMKPYYGTKDLMRYYKENMMETLEWNMEKRECSFYCWGKIVHPYIVHYATYNTWTLKYSLLNRNVRNEYFKVKKIFRYLCYICIIIKWGVSKRQLKRFFNWLSWHFTSSYWKVKLRKNNLNNIRK